MSYNEIIAAARRLVIVQLLRQDPGYDMNEHVLIDLLGQFGHQISRDVLRTELAWLAEQGLVSISTVAGSVQVAKLTSRGNDAAIGRGHFPGVKRPGPDGF